MATLVTVTHEVTREFVVNVDSLARLAPDEAAAYDLTDDAARKAFAVNALLGCGGPDVFVTLPCVSEPGVPSEEAC